jgi:Cof subfamily protein (haloacid dehalogenase superfamily)
LFVSLTTTMSMIPSSEVKTKPAVVTPQESSVDEQSYRMVALDLDGTLLHSDHKMSTDTRDYLCQLDQRGFTVVIATGRSATTVYEQVEHLNLPHPLPVVCSNGSRGLLCSVDGPGKISSQELFSYPVPESIARKTIALTKELGYVSQYYVGEHIYADPRQAHHLELTELYMKLTGSKTIYVEDDFEAVMKLGLPSKQLVFCRPEEQDAMVEAFQIAFRDEAYLIRGKSATIIRGNLGWFLEILHPEVCKGFGLKSMCQHLNIPIQDVVAFGDGDNDYEFIQMAGKGIVMKNGGDVCKKVADEVIDFTNNEDGVLKTLQRMEMEGALVFPTK